jgi:hypothetical protein
MRIKRIRSIKSIKSSKAVIFVPYTHGSRLTKRLREVEMTLEEQTGYRLKIVERGGRRLEDLLHMSDPWEGKLCERPKCLPCKTKSETGQFSNQSCHKHSVVYETWCVTCDLGEMTGLIDGDDEIVEGSMQQNRIETEKKMAKYIGETARSTYKRGFEHLSDLLNLSQKSHMLGHYVKSHMGEDFGKMRFQMRTLRITKTAFERQVLKSVLIQENRSHNLLNSKSEFNRCSIPRITLKMGDSEIPMMNKKAALEMQKEETIFAKIRDLRKEVGTKRGNMKGNPKRKKMRLCESDDMVVVIPDCVTEVVSAENKRQIVDEKEKGNPKASKRQKMMTDFLISSEAKCGEVVPYGMRDVGPYCSRGVG